MLISKLKKNISCFLTGQTVKLDPIKRLYSLSPNTNFNHLDLNRDLWIEFLKMNDK